MKGCAHTDGGELDPTGGPSVGHLVGSGAALAVGPAGALYVLGDAAVEWLGKVFAGPQKGDERRFPFAVTDDAGYAAEVRGDLRAFGLGVSAGDTHNVSPEYAEAFARLRTIEAIASVCGIEDEARKAAAVIAKALNVGLYGSPDGGWRATIGDPKGDVCGRRPARGEVRAWLEAYAKRMGERCRSQKIGELGAKVGRALDEPVSSDLPGFKLTAWHVLGGAGVLAGLWWALRGAS